VFGGLRQLGAACGAGQLGVDAIPCPHKHARAVEELGRDHAVEDLADEGVERGLQLAHDTSQQFDQVFEV
jgi:hypothetical protein